MKKTLEISGRAPLAGCDIYHGNMPFSRWFGDFQIHKATEGVTFNDSDFSSWCKEYTGYKGAYHFMSKKTTQNWKEQACHFLRVLRENDFSGIVILDLESTALTEAINNPYGVLSFVDFVESEICRPVFLYTNTFGTNKLDIKFARMPMWIASYNKETPNINEKFKKEHMNIYGKEYFIWQYITNPFDLDIANMTTYEWEDMSY